MPEWPEVAAKRVELRKEGVYSYGGRIRRMGRMPRRVREYGRPALHVFGDGVVVRGFAWRGSMEGVHAGSRPFDGRNMRQRHLPVRVTFDGLFCDDIGEDCVSIQPRAHVTLRNSRFRGNFLRRRGEGDRPGMDKIVQIDGATVVIENCDFFNGATAIRGKANSRIVVRNCRFVDCGTAIAGDGGPNPRPGQEYDNGRAGKCVIEVVDCTFWRCRTAFRADDGCTITVRRSAAWETWRERSATGSGRVRIQGS